MIFIVSVVQKVRLGLAISYGMCICVRHFIFILEHGSVHFPLFLFAELPYVKQCVWDDGWASRKLRVLLSEEARWLVL